MYNAIKEQLYAFACGSFVFGGRDDPLLMQNLFHQT